MAARLERQANNGVRGDPRQAARLTDADPLLEVGEDGESLLLGKAAVEQGGPLPLAEAVLAGAASQVTPLLGRAVAKGDAEVAQTTLAIVRTVGILAAEVLEFVHGLPGPKNKWVVAVTLPLG